MLLPNATAEHRRPSTAECLEQPLPTALPSPEIREVDFWVQDRLIDLFLVLLKPCDLLRMAVAYKGNRKVRERASCIR